MLIGTVYSDPGAAGRRHHRPDEPPQGRRPCPTRSPDYDANGYVTGTTAAQVDFRDIVASRLPLIIGVVVAPRLPDHPGRLPGPARRGQGGRAQRPVDRAPPYGVVVAVFQWGWGGPALGVSGTVPIESYVPMMMFAIIFGLSMDYEIFLLSRVHEAWLRTGDAKAPWRTPWRSPPGSSPAPR